MTTSAAGSVAAVRALMSDGDAEGALAAVDAVLARTPASVDALVTKARILLQRKRFDAALDALSEAVLYDAACSQAHYEMGNVHRLQSSPDLAAACYAQAIAIDPEHVGARMELGGILQRAGRLQEAREQLLAAAALAPDDLAVLNQLGLVLVRCELFDDALPVYERICARSPSSVLVPRVNLSNLLLRTGAFGRAEEVIGQILAFEPNNYEARWNRAHLLLARHQFEAGWTDYDYRLLLRTHWPARLVPYPMWTDEPLPQRTLLVLAEQGLGDQIMFASCLPDLQRLGARLVVECEHRLAPIFERSFPDARVIGSAQAVRPEWLGSLPDIDFCVPLGSLPGRFRRDRGDFPRHRGYLRANPARVDAWRARLASLGGGRTIGISWRGGTQQTRAGVRSIPLDALLPVLSVPGCRFVSLQYGDCADEVARFESERGIRLEHWPEAIADYDETAALVEALDLVLSVQTAVIHLAGALGRTTWVMVPAAPEWRYGAQGAEMPWYPSVVLFRQAVLGDWSDVIGTIARRLAESP